MDKMITIRNEDGLEISYEVPPEIYCYIRKLESEVLSRGFKKALDRMKNCYVASIEDAIKNEKIK